MFVFVGEVVLQWVVGIKLVDGFEGQGLEVLGVESGMVVVGVVDVDL